MRTPDAVDEIIAISSEEDEPVYEEAHSEEGVLTPNGPIVDSYPDDKADIKAEILRLLGEVDRTLKQMAEAFDTPLPSQANKPKRKSYMQRR